jgi:hypothetical protein
MTFGAGLAAESSLPRLLVPGPGRSKGTVQGDGLKKGMVFVSFDEKDYLRS